MDYEFINPGMVRFNTRVAEQNAFIDTTQPIWEWKDGGTVFRIDWPILNFIAPLKGVLQGFIFHRLETMSPRSISGHDSKMLELISESSLSQTFLWQNEEVVQFHASMPSANSSFRVFYLWCVQRNISGFDWKTYLELKEYKIPTRNSYENIFLNQKFITINDENKILNYIENSYNEDDWSSIRDNVILQLGFELAPRPIQLHCLNESDLEVYPSEDLSDPSYYTLWLPMAKKIKISTVEKRPRSLSKQLGKKIERLISLNNNLLTDGHGALFLTERNKRYSRMSSYQIGKVVTNALAKIGFKEGEALTALRHHLGQSLADQGASAETIAEILGHNSTVPARAYISATPEIAEIKTKALGKNNTYLDIIDMITTGEIIEKSKVPKERWVKGMVGFQYIGSIGGCGLNSNTACPKNPVYSCYTCEKFHPFVDGEHLAVKSGLELQSQFFIDTANSAMDLERNRSVIQLESTIAAVNAVVNLCNNYLQEDGNE